MSINPTSLSLPSPRASPVPADSPSPAPPSRKRARAELSPDDRKEARAHRNRIAAQNSRDRRKAQFSYLERRVAELEEENRQLRAGLAMSTAVVPAPVTPSTARDKENEELRERIRTLEKGWDAVVKALAAQGLPTGIPSPPTSSSSATPVPDDSSSTSNSTTAFPVLVPPPTSFPVSPAPSHSSLSSSSVFDEFDTGGEHRGSCTGVPAAGGLPTTISQPTLDTSSPSELQFPPSPIDDVAMEEFFREILETSPAMPSTSLPPDTPSVQVPQPAALAPTTTPLTNPQDVDWIDADEMQRMLDILPSVQTDIQPTVGDDAFDFPSALNLDLGVSGWELDHWVSSSSEIGVL